MAKYNFNVLSFQDFEDLVRDLLQAKLGIDIEAFATGSDKGVDLRFTILKDGETVIQCKHYIKSGPRKLINNLRNKEIQKVIKLKPNNYILVTSCDLSVNNKDEILEIMQPFIKNSSDIIAQKDLENLLSQHSEVEKIHYKLWITSTSVMERIIHNAEYSQTEFLVEEIENKIKMFVKTPAFKEAINKLEEYNFVVISGIPGIGKTKLAEMLIYLHMSMGYQPVIIQSNISEGKNLFRKGKRQIFYFDDFLGQTFFGDRKEYLGQNQDSEVEIFASMIRKSKNSRFILTAREHIIQSARQESEKLDSGELLENRYILNLENYSKFHRAQILFNHLYFSDLPGKCIESILENGFILEIIKHKNYNPRLIEYLASYRRIPNDMKSDYCAYIQKLLNHPEKLWLHAYYNQISFAARHLLLVLYTMGPNGGNEVTLKVMFNSFNSYIKKHRNKIVEPNEYRKALKSLEGGFIIINKNNIDFISPSIREFVATIIRKDENVAEDIIHSATNIKQLIVLWQLANANSDTELVDIFKTKEDVFKKVLPHLLDVSFEIWNCSGSWIEKELINSSYIEVLRFIVQCAIKHQSKYFLKIGIQVTKRLRWCSKISYVYFSDYVNLLHEIAENDWLLHSCGKELCSLMMEFFIEQLEYANSKDWANLIKKYRKLPLWTESDEDKLLNIFGQYCDSSLYNEIENCSNIDELDELRRSIDELEVMANYCGHDLDESYAIIETRYEELYEEYESDNFDHYENSVSHNVVDISDDEIIDMFSSLLENYK